MLPTELVWTIESYPADTLFVDRDVYQRDVVPSSKVVRAARSGKLHAMLPLFVNVRADGVRSVFDGGNRLEARRIAYGDDALVQCCVTTGLVASQEASIFLSQNADSSPMGSSWNHRARLVA